MPENYIRIININNILILVANYISDIIIVIFIKLFNRIYKRLIYKIKEF